MEESWEFLSVPAEIQHSTVKRNMDKQESDTGESSQDKINKAKQTIPKLCGFLNKFGAKGFIKSWKTRWFVYDESLCKLYYFRTPQDHVPLGTIDISNATFSFNVETSDRGLNQFSVCTVDRVYQLQAKDKQTMMFWLQELQTRRRAYSRKKTNLAKEKKEDVSTVLQPTDGLLGDEAKEKEAENHDKAEPVHPPILTQVPPPESVGEEAALKSPSTRLIKDFSITNIRTELKNMSAKRSSMNISSMSCSTANSISAPLTQAELDKIFKEQQSAPAPCVNEVKPNEDQPANSSSFQSYVAPEIPAEVNTEHENSSNERSNSSEEKSKSFSPDFRFKRTADSLRRKFVNRPTPSVGEPRSSGKCLECEKLRFSLANAETELKGVNDKMSARDEVIESLHGQIRNFQLEKSESEEKGQRNVEEELFEKKNYIIQLEGRLRQLSHEIEGRNTVLSSMKKDLAEKNDVIQMYQEMVEVKDQIVVSLTNQLYNMENSRNTSVDDAVEAEEVEEIIDRPLVHANKKVADSSLCFSSSVDDSIDTINEMDKLKEACQAYTLQNKFLNSEILELNKLRQDDNERLKALTIKLATVEAEMCKFQSRYYLLLRELQKPRSDALENESRDQDLVTNLLQDAIDTETSLHSTLSRPSWEPYDKWGFVQRANSKDTSEEVLLNIANKLDRKSGEIKANLDSMEMSVGVKWENYLVTHKNRDLQKTPELKLLIRAGVPHEHRNKVWKWCIDYCVRETKKIAGDGYYQNLLENIEGKPSPAVKQIELDLLRTLPNNKHYDKPDADGIAKLRRVLLAYSWHNLDVGYCQGLNRLVAIALLYLTEEEAFWCLVAIIEHIMPKDYYSKTLLASQADQRVLRDLLGDKLPRLQAHIDNIRVDLSLVTFNWFLTIFVDGFPIQTILRIWDTFLYEGNKVLFRYALAVFKTHEENLLKLNDHMSIFNYMRQMPEKIIDPHTFSQVAFQGLNPFPMQKIRTKRTLCITGVKAELAELDKLREDYVSTKSEEQEDVFSEED